MRRFIDRASRFFYGPDPEEEARKIAEERHVAEEARLLVAEQEQEETIAKLGTYAGRLVLVANFGRLPNSPITFEGSRQELKEVYAKQLARKMHDSIFKDIDRLGLSAYASGRARHLDEPDFDSYEFSADLLEFELYRAGFQVYRPASPEFDRGLGLSQIVAGAEEAEEHFGSKPEKIGHVAIVSAQNMAEVNLGYPDPGYTYSLKDIDENDEFSWTEFKPID